MKNAPIPSFEQERLRIVKSMKLLDHQTDEQIKKIIDFCSRRFDVPIAMVNLVGESKQYFYANKGLEHLHETDRDISFCGHAIVDSEVFEIPDTSKDERFKDNPLVTGAPFIQFYAGKRLKYRNQPIGTLCLIDRKPNKLEDQEIELLELLASQVEILIRNKEQHIVLNDLYGKFGNELERLQGTRVELKRILAAIGHDVIGPVRNVRSLLELAPQLELDEFRSILVKAENAVKGSESLLHDMVHWGKLQSESETQQFEKVELALLFQELAQELAVGLEEKGNELNIEAGNIRLLTQAAPLKFILRNLILNANKFSENSTLLLKASEKESSVLIQVIDQGIGISHEQLQRLNSNTNFQSNLGTKGEKGHGLGLRLSHDFAHDINAKLHFEANENKGIIANLSIEKKNR